MRLLPRAWQPQDSRTSHQFRASKESVPESKAKAAVPFLSGSLKPQDCPDSRRVDLEPRLLGRNVKVTGQMSMGNRNMVVTIDGRYKLPGLCLQKERAFLHMNATQKKAEP